MPWQLEDIRPEAGNLHVAVVFALPQENNISRRKVLAVTVVHPIDRGVGGKEAIASIRAVLHIASRSARVRSALHGLIYCGEAPKPGFLEVNREIWGDAAPV